MIGITHDHGDYNIKERENLGLTKQFSKSWNTLRGRNFFFQRSDFAQTPGELCQSARRGLIDVK